MNNLKTIITASILAGKEILKVYKTDFNVEYKSDESPLTLADKKAHEVIISFLRETEIPVLSEEGRDIPFKERKHWNKLWIVDPLDGTKEFVKRNDEFTVNIALVENGEPVMGVVYAPVLDELYTGKNGLGSFKVEKASEMKDIMEIFTDKNRLPLPAFEKKGYFGIVASRSHLNEETTQFINEIKKDHDKVKIVSKGSSLKLCMVAEGAADIYPRFAPTMEWDTAAGDAVVRAADGTVVHAKTNSPLVYNKENLLNPWFVVKR